MAIFSGPLGNSVPATKKLDGSTGQIWIFLDVREFSEPNLTLLFRYLSKKYPSPQRLDIWLETSWDNVPSPNLECDDEGSAESGGQDRADVPRAVYFRRGKDEIYRFNPDRNIKALKTVVLKGKSF